MEETYTGISITLDPESLRKLDELVKRFQSNRSQACRISINQTYDQEYGPRTATPQPQEERTHA